MKGEYSRPTRDTPSKRMKFYLDNKHHKVTLCKHVTLTTYTKVWAKVGTEISGLTHRDLQYTF